jgi:hypothetical protein
MIYLVDVTVYINDVNIMDKNINICGDITEDLLGVGAEVSIKNTKFKLISCQ